MVIISKKAAQRTLSAFHEILFECLRAGIVAWRSTRSAFGAKGVSTLRANAIHVAACNEARARFEGVEGARVRGDGGRFLIEFDGDAPLVVHFKKMSEELLSSTYPTAAARAFRGQMRLPGLPDLPRVTVGYVLPKAEGEVDDLDFEVHVALQDERRVSWSYELDASQASGIVPISPIAPAAGPTTKRVRIKKQAQLDLTKKKQGTDDDG